MTSIPTPVLDDRTLYLGDNGRCYCGEHSGMSARYTGRDISGNEVLPLCVTLVVAEGIDPAEFSCDEPRCDRTLADADALDAETD